MIIRDVIAKNWIFMGFQWNHHGDEPLLRWFLRMFFMIKTTVQLGKGGPWCWHRITQFTVITSPSSVVIFPWFVPFVAEMIFPQLRRRRIAKLTARAGLGLRSCRFHQLIQTIQMMLGLSGWSIKNINNSEKGSTRNGRSSLSLAAFVTYGTPELVRKTVRTNQWVIVL